MISEAKLSGCKTLGVVLERYSPTLNEGEGAETVRLRVSLSFLKRFRNPVQFPLYTNSGSCSQVTRPARRQLREAV